MKFYKILYASILLFHINCTSQKTPVTPPVVPPPVAPLVLKAAKVNLVDMAEVVTKYNVNTTSVFKISFTNAISKNTATSAISLYQSGTNTTINISFENNDSTIVIAPAATLKSLSQYALTITTQLLSVKNEKLKADLVFNFITQIDSTNKFPVLTDNALLDTIQRRTFAYFWEYGHPVSGLARERSNSTPETITSGGSGFGIMAIPVAINRNFITKAQGLARMQTIVAFLKNTAQKFHGAFPHWLNGTTGVVIPFSQKDNGADIVETSYLMAGLLTVRQYFNGTNAAETALRNDINILWNGVEWNWFTNGAQNVLYWHWSPNYNWEMNHQIKGWNECLVTYVLAAASNTWPITKPVYTSGWASNGATNSGFINGNSSYGYQLPLGTSFGGPLFFSHYSFLGINPNGLADSYANYQTQTKNHSLINYEYCKANPKAQFGYSESCWGLTASDIRNGYTASSPTNDMGFIAPTAALSSFPYTPVESMKALKFFYYTLGDKIFKEYGFVDAFSLKELWYADSYLAIDQGPIIVMLENYRSGLVWNLLSSCPEVKNGLKNVLGFTAPYL
jgi:hypothetical protein